MDSQVYLQIIKKNAIMFFVIKWKQIRSMKNITLNDKLVKILNINSSIEIQNKLMSVPNREIALSMMYMKDVERNNLLTRLSETKAKRVVDELKFINRVNVKYDLYCVSINRVIKMLQNEKNDGVFKSYSRPKRSKY